MKKFFLLLLLPLVAATIQAQSPIPTTQSPREANNESCTSIMVGRKASADGSVMTSHTCDSWYRTWMTIEPAHDYDQDATTRICEGLMHTEHATDETGVKERGTIPQASHTYRFLNTAYPCLNEHQLAMGETTIGGRDTLQNKDGMFMIEELARVALQRCTSARQAIRLMGQLAKQYGYGDSGECLTIADTAEVWIFEIFGEGPKKKGAVWAAQRIPDDCIAVSANISRIGAIDPADTLNYLASENVYDVARKLKLWDGKEPFSFWRAYSGGNYFNEPKNYSVRELYIMQQLAPSAGFNNEMEELPVAVRPEQPVTVDQVARLLGSYYEGTELDNSARLKIKDSDGDSIISPVANPWIRPDEIALAASLMNDSTYQNIRTVAVSWCAYSTIIQCRSWLPDAVGGVAWVCLDNPGQSPRFPIFAGNTQLPPMLGICGQHRNRQDAALYHYRQANRLATVRWGTARKTMEPAQRYFLQKGQRELPFVQSTYASLPEADQQEFLDGYTRDFFAATILRWDELSNAYWRQFWAGW